MGGIFVTKWGVYLADVPFEDLPQSKCRPVIILDDTTVAVVCLKMTSHPPRAGEYALQKWQEAGLRKQTTVRISKILSLPPSSFLRQLGSLHPVDIIEISKRLSS